MAQYNVSNKGAQTVKAVKPQKAGKGATVVKGDDLRCKKGK